MISWAENNCFARCCGTAKSLQNRHDRHLGSNCRGSNCCAVGNDASEASSIGRQCIGDRLLQPFCDLWFHRGKSMLHKRCNAMVHSNRRGLSALQLVIFLSVIALAVIAVIEIL
jgi:hypothetical protein